MSVQSRPRHGSTDQTSRERDALRREIERLWYTLALIERLKRPFQELPIPVELFGRETSRIHAAAAHLRRLSAILMTGVRPDDGLSYSFDCGISQDGGTIPSIPSNLSTLQAHQLFALSFAGQEISRGVAELHTQMVCYLDAASRG